MRTLTKLAGAAVIGLTMVAGAVAADVISDRQAGFKGHSDNIKAVKAAIDGGDASAAVGPAEMMLAYAQTIASRFPEGSGDGDTRAKSEIWSDWDGFKAAADKHVDEVVKLVAAAKSGNVSALGDQLKATGGSCGGCHKPYRAEKN